MTSTEATYTTGNNCRKVGKIKRFLKDSKNTVSSVQQGKEECYRLGMILGQRLRTHLAERYNSIERTGITHLIANKIIKYNPLTSTRLFILSSSSRLEAGTMRLSN